jgi:hypothetical protein
LEWLRPAGFVPFEALSLLKDGLMGVAVGGLIDSLLKDFEDFPIVMSYPRSEVRSLFIFSNSFSMSFKVGMRSFSAEISWMTSFIFFSRKEFFSKGTYN